MNSNNNDDIAEEVLAVMGISSFGTAATTTAKTRYLQRTDFLTKLQTKMRDRGISEDEEIIKPCPKMISLTWMLVTPTG